MLRESGAGQREIGVERRGEVSIRHSRPVARLKALTMKGEGYQVKSSGNASDNRPESAVTKSRDEPAAGERDMPESIPNSA